MNANSTTVGRRFLGRFVSVCALCALLGLPALGQNPGAGAAKPATGSQPQGGAAKDVTVTDYGTVDISVQDTDLAVVLQMLSIEGKKNIIVGKNVSGTVSANLYDVTFYEALKAILEVNGYRYYEEGNFIYVITKEEAQAMEKANRRTESRIFELENLSAADALEFVLPLLSDVGRASARGDVKPGMKPTVADNGADSYTFSPRIVVNDYPDHLEAVATLLAELDVKPQQVLVEATIVQTTLDEANAFGVDFTILGSLNFTDIVNPLSAVNGLLAGGGTGGVQPADNNAQAVSTSVGNTAGPGGLKIGILSDDIAVFLRVLDEVTDSNVLARPKVMALNRQRAEVLVGARVGYLSTTSTETTTTQSVSFLDTGIQLVFRPFISRDGMIRMELKPSVSEASLRSVTDANGLIVTIPDELTNELTTNVRIRDGQTLVLGGLFKDSTRITRRQVPLLGDIPIVGAAFRGQDDHVERSEIIFLITPSIVHDDLLWARGQDTLDAVDSMRVGARAGLLPFSRDKLTARYNQSAVDAFQKGDADRALFYINNSLHLSPSQPEMIRLRDRITGERSRTHERSLMERVFRREIKSPRTPPPAELIMAPTDSSAAITTDPAAIDGAGDDNGYQQPGCPIRAMAQFMLPPGSSQPANAATNDQGVQFNTPVAIDDDWVIDPDHWLTAQQPQMATTPSGTPVNSAGTGYATGNASTTNAAATQSRNPNRVVFVDYPPFPWQPDKAVADGTPAASSASQPLLPVAMAPANQMVNNSKSPATAIQPVNQKPATASVAQQSPGTLPPLTAQTTVTAPSTQQAGQPAVGSRLQPSNTQKPTVQQAANAAQQSTPAAAQTRQAAGSSKPTQPANNEQWRSCRAFLYEYFMALGLPHIAANYAPTENGVPGVDFPFTTFEESGVANVPGSQDPRN